MIIELPVSFVVIRTRQMLDHISEKREQEDTNYLATIRDSLLNRKWLRVFPRKQLILTDNELIDYAESHSDLFGWRSRYASYAKCTAADLIKACRLAKEADVKTISLENKDIAIFKWFDN